jgi:hypothetical protein
MDMPSRIEIRSWLSGLTREQIMERLDVIRAEHGAENEQDVRDWLNHEREQAKQGIVLTSPAEQSLLSEIEQRKERIAAEIESLKRLHADRDEVA